ncbi:MAG: M15 family metallopeptidase [Actinomycetota bacterium]
MGVERLLPFLLAAAVVSTPVPAAADDGGAVEATYSESNGCGIPRSFAPLSGRQGGLADYEPIRGPFGAIFGRTVGQARAAIVRWTVPFTTLSVSVHQRALPAFQQVTANLAASGGFYPTRASETYGFTARTVNGTKSISYHAVGAAIDINSRSNPAHDALLLTDMPPWYVDAWRRAGFCWGGDWVGKKDPMHFSWMGPLATPGHGPTPVPYPSLANLAAFTEIPAIHHAGLGGRRSAATDALADLTGDGSLDVVRIKTHNAAGPIVEVMGSWADFGTCGLARFQLPGADISRRVIFGNTTYGGRADLVFLDFSGSHLTLHQYGAGEFYQQHTAISTGIPSDPDAGYVLADYDVDGRSDLFVVASGNLSVWSAASGYAALATTAQVAVPVGSAYAAGDRDQDGRADLYVIGADGKMQVLTAATGFSSSETFGLPLAVGSNDVFEVSDYDGDGHDDLYRLDVNGSIVVMLGNQQIYADIDGWFRAPEFTCPPDQPVYDFAGRFADDDANPFLGDIEWAAASGVTVGCNPPFADWFCPKLAVSRAQMATFLVRALSLPAAGADAFTDDAGSPHESDINAIAAAGITVGCGQGVYCPHATITREQLATFLAGAYRLPSVATNPFADVAGPHAADVAALSAAGITSGCSAAPMLFCPTAPVLREQMAAFLNRAEHR